MTLRTLTVLTFLFPKSSSVCTYVDMYVDDFADFDCLKSPFSKAQQRMYVRRHVRHDFADFDCLNTRFRKRSSVCTYVDMYVDDFADFALRVRFQKRSSACTYVDMYVDDFADFDCLKTPFSKAQHRMYVRRRLCGL